MNKLPSIEFIYKVVDRKAWSTARSAGRFEGAEVDLQDGYIHFSTASQVVETVRRHFAGQADLLLLEVPVAVLGETLRWEPSRGGDLFPHLYAELLPEQVIREWELPLRDGTHLFPQPWPPIEAE